MPEDYDLYYGFTRFAIELNEMEHDQIHLYAPTDTRFRKDQRSVLTDTRFRKDQRSVPIDTRFRKDQRLADDQWHSIYVRSHSIAYVKQRP